jgi:glutaminyl-tRNA synthetase
MTRAASNFIKDIVQQDLAANTHGGRVATRFPPEPNGYLHIGHAKSVCLNFGLARDFGGVCHLRFDDTNPLTESTEFVEAIQRDIRWLGFDWGEHLYFASDYFERLYAFAEELITKGKAYVCSLSEDEVKEYRGTVTEPGRPSPDRDRPVSENLDLFRRMRKGEFEDGELVLRAKISLDSANMKMRDPAIYRIRHAHHHRTGDKWCIYPLYDFTHGLSDSIEHITHSICTLEFENNRELYDWFLANVSAPFPSRQYEFAALDLNYTVTSKRKLKELVEKGLVAGWDDPRLPTLSAFRRRGYTPESIRAFCEQIGVGKNNSTVDVGLLEHSIRSELNQSAKRVLAVLSPLRVVVTSYPEREVESIDARYFPEDVGAEGSRPLPFSRELYIERDDFEENPPAGWKRLAPGREVRLRHAYVVRCDAVKKDEHGNVTELHCTHDPETRDGPPRDGRRVAGTIHWLSAAEAVPCEVRLYDRLFSVEDPTPTDGPDFKTFLNPNALEVKRGLVEPSVRLDPKETRYQFERLGFFWQDPVDSGAGALVFNRIVSLKDSWAKAVQVQEHGRSAGHEKQVERRRERDAKKQAQQEQDKARGVSLDTLGERLASEHGLLREHAKTLSTQPALLQLFEAARAQGADAKAVASLVVGEIARVAKDPDQKPIGPDQVAELAKLVALGVVTARGAKDVIVEMARTGSTPKEVVAALGLERVSDTAVLLPVVDAVLSEFADKVTAYRAGNHNLLGLFVGQVMQRTRGKADPALVNQLLCEKLG